MDVGDWVAKNKRTKFKNLGSANPATAHNAHNDPPINLWSHNDQFQQFIDSIRDLCIFQTDPQGHIVTWGNGAERLFGLASDETLATSASALLFPESQDAHTLSTLLEHARTHGKADYRGWQRRQHTGRFYADALITPVYRNHSELSGFAIIVRDITDKKMAEDEQLRHFHLCQQANRMKDEFLATLSHELRTPLGVILGNLELMAGAIPGSSDYQESFDAIQRNARLQSQLIKDLLDVSRIITGKLTLSLQSVDFISLVRSSLDSLRYATQSKGLHLTSAIANEAAMIRADPDRLQQVLCNLLSNAIKFTPRGGHIHLEVKKHPTQVELIVQDTGCGIDPEFLPFVFERFRQEDNSHARSYGGLGLGLAIVRHIIELHKGTIQAVSIGKGHGSTFTVALPLDPTIDHLNSRAFERATANPQNPTDHLETACPPLNNLRILIVDDQADSLNMLSRMLQQAGAVTTVATSSTLALDYACRQSFDLMMFDIGIPDLDGLQLLGQIRAQSEHNTRTPAIALTGYARLEDRQACERAGYALHLAKPLSQSDLMGAVSRVIDSKNL